MLARASKEVGWQALRVASPWMAGMGIRAYCAASYWRWAELLSQTFTQTSLLHSEIILKSSGAFGKEEPGRLRLRAWAQMGRWADTEVVWISSHTSDSVGFNIRANCSLNRILTIRWDSINMETSDCLSLGTPNDCDGPLCDICDTCPTGRADICTYTQTPKVRQPSVSTTVC